MLLVESEGGKVRLNNFSTLVRWTKDGLGNNVDRLAIDFDTTELLCRSLADIKSRDYEGIIAECDAATKNYLDDVYKHAVSDLKAGLWIGKDKESWVQIP